MQIHKINTKKGVLIMAVTIKDIADKVQVSPSTISRVFNNPDSVATDTKEKVLKVAYELGYKFKKSKQVDDQDEKNICIVNSHNNIFTIPYYVHLISGVESRLREYNYNLIFKTTTGNIEDDFDEIMNLYTREKIDGLILTGHRIPKELILKLNDTDIPIVLLDNNLWDENIDCVVNDNASGAKKMVNYLIDQGHQEIAFFGSSRHTCFYERFKGYQDGLREAGIELAEEFVYFCYPDFTGDEGYKAAHDFLEKLPKIPSAILVSNDHLAFKLIRAVTDLGYKIPEDVSIVGFDNTDMAKDVIPPLTTVKIFKEEMGDLAAKRLYELIHGENLKPIKITLTVEPVIRESTARCIVEKQSIKGA